MAKTKFEKATEAFDSLDLGDKIVAHKQNAQSLKQAIEDKQSELRSQLNNLQETHEQISN